MFNELYFQALLRLVISIIIGGAIGFERAERGREAGIRTHIILCMGSALVMITSEYLHQTGMSFDIARLGAQVISGIGFLGVGCIITTGDKIKGLTTAAGIWTTACIGLAVGSGFYDISITAATLMLGSLYILKPMVDKIQSKFVNMTLTVRADKLETMRHVIEYCEQKNIIVKSVKAEEHKTYVKTIFDVKLSSAQEANAIILDLLEINGVSAVYPIGL